MTVKDFFPLLKRLPQYGKLAYVLLNSSDISKKNKLLLAGGVVYLISPIDLVPGFIPVLGQLDDLLVVLTLLKKIMDNLPPAMSEEYLSKQDLTIDHMENDLILAQDLAKIVSNKTLGGVKKFFRSSGKVGYQIATLGSDLIAKGAANLVSSRLKK